MEISSKFIFNQFSLITKETPLGRVPYIPELLHSDKIRYQVQVPFSVVENTMDNSAPCLKYLLIFSPRCEITVGDESFNVRYVHRTLVEDYVIDMRGQLDFFESMVFNKQEEFTRCEQTELSFNKLRVMMARYADIIQMPCVFDKYINNVVGTLSGLYTTTDVFETKASFSITKCNKNETLDVADYKVLCKKLVCTKFELEITDDQCVIEFETRGASSYFHVGLGKSRSNYVEDGRYRTSIISYTDAFRRYGEEGKLVFSILAYTHDDQEILVRKYVSQTLDELPVIAVAQETVHAITRELQSFHVPPDTKVVLCQEHRGCQCAIRARGVEFCIRDLKLRVWKSIEKKGVYIVRIPVIDLKSIMNQLYSPEQMKYLTQKSQYRDLCKLRVNND